MKPIILILALALAGCNGTKVISVNGPAVEAPSGYVDYCNRHPDRAECGK